MVIKNRKRSLSHASKTIPQRQFYRSFLAKKDSLGGTESENPDPKRTDISPPFDDEGSFTKDLPIKRPSLLTRIRDISDNNWVVSIVGGLVVLCIGGAITAYISLNNEQTRQDQRIITLEGDLKDFSEQAKEGRSKFDILREEFITFKTKMLKDLQYNLKNLKE